MLELGRPKFSLSFTCVLLYSPILFTCIPHCELKPKLKPNELRRIGCRGSSTTAWLLAGALPKLCKSFTGAYLNWSEMDGDEGNVHVRRISKVTKGYRETWL